MAQFTWGLGKLLTIELALILELPNPARFVILGKLRLLVPDPAHPLVRIQVDLVGEINFTTRKAFVLARLVDSKLTRFDLKGAAAIYVDWGDNPTFIMSFGGFNPRYHLPQGVPPELASLERLTVSLARDKHLELTFTAYLAFTPNTFQVGGSIHAFASAGKFSIDGFLSVEALIDRHEGTFFIDLEARLQLKAWGVNLFMVSFKGTLSGPSPIRVKGKATFSIWIFDYSVPIDVNLGSIGAPPALPVADVLPVLLTALRSPQNWSAELPTGTAGAGDGAEDRCWRVRAASARDLDHQAERRAAWRSHRSLRAVAAGRRRTFRDRRCIGRRPCRADDGGEGALCALGVLRSE